MRHLVKFFLTISNQFAFIELWLVFGHMCRIPAWKRVSAYLIGTFVASGKIDTWASKPIKKWVYFSSLSEVGQDGCARRRTSKSLNIRWIHSCLWRCRLFHWWRNHRYWACWGSRQRFLANSCFKPKLKTMQYMLQNQEVHYKNQRQCQYQCLTKFWKNILWCNLSLFVWLHLCWQLNNCPIF